MAHAYSAMRLVSSGRPGRRLDARPSEEPVVVLDAFERILCVEEFAPLIDSFGASPKKPVARVTHGLL
jgi:hypothetical protein